MDYVNTLSVEDKEVYTQKLRLLDGTYFPDPFSRENENNIQWRNDPGLWPSISYFDIINYFVYSTSLYSLEETKAYKSLDGYNYAINGHVQEILCFNPTQGEQSKYCALKTKVLPSQRQGVKTTMYDVFTVVNVETGKIITTHCSCMAGNGKACSHAAALCFKLEFAVRSGLTKTASTSELCSWNSSAKKRAQPARIRDIDFKRPKYGEDHMSRSPRCGKPQNKKTANLQDILLKFPHAVICKSLSIVKNDCKMDLPLTVQEAISNHKENFLEALVNSMGEIALRNIEYITRKQSSCNEWFAHRYGRVTSSTMYRVLRATSTDVILKLICDKQDLEHIPAVKYGREMEEPAREMYIKAQSENHINFLCSTSGLRLNKNFPSLGASPDGMVNCVCCDRGCLEIKCPFRYKDGLPTNINEHKNFPLYCRDGTDHSYSKMRNKINFC